MKGQNYPTTCAQACKMRKPKMPRKEKRKKINQCEDRRFPLVHNCPLKGIGVRDIIIMLGDFSFFFVAVFHWMRIEISRNLCVFRGRDVGFGADS